MYFNSQVATSFVQTNNNVFELLNVVYSYVYKTSQTELSINYWDVETHEKMF